MQMNKKEASALLLLFVLPALLLAQPQQNPQWTPTGTLGTGRYFHTATLLPNGKVLIVGGIGTNGVLNSAELYDPAARTWRGTGSLNSAGIARHSATLLPNGKVLVAGGIRRDNSFGNIAELYDPLTERWASTGNLNISRIDHTAVLLHNGKVLIVGGLNNTDVLSSAELYDPVTGQWRLTGSLREGRSFHTATLLSNGKVLVAGGRGNSTVAIGDLDSAEVYDPITEIWSLTGSLKQAREHHTATRLPDGKILAVGGIGPIPITNGVSYPALNSAELYNPASGVWQLVGSTNAPRYLHTATALPDGRVLAVAGTGSRMSAEIFDSYTGMWGLTASLSVGRSQHTETRLQTGNV